MNDYLEKICLNLGIKLLYTNNKHTVLSAETRGSLSLLRVHKLFKNCPAKVAQAIVGYYTDDDNKLKYESIILDFVNQLYPSNSFKIKNTESEIKEKLKKDIPTKNNINSPSLVELEVSSLVVKDFWGNELNSNPDASIKPLDNDFLELDIVIKPPVT